MQKLHYYFGYGGLIPFVGLGAAALFYPSHAFYSSALIDYAALIFSFMR